MTPQLLEEANRVRTKFPDLIESDDYKLSLFGINVNWEYVLGINALCAQDIIEEQNADIRMALIRALGFDKFIQQGGGKLIREPDADDYQDGSIYLLELNNQQAYFLKLINQTIEPGTEELTEEQRVASGLTADGRKIYVLGIPHNDFKTIRDAIGWTFGLGEGEYWPDVEA